MKIEDYTKYYIQGSDHYLIPKDVFNELFNEMSNWREESKELNQKYLNAVADYETTMSELQELKKENKILRKNAENNDKVVDKVNWENMLLKKENKELKDLIDTILNFSFFKEECPLNFGFENSTNEDKSQSIFYEDEWCENNCNDNYKDCWLKYFKKMQELEQGSDNDDRYSN